MRLDKFLKLSRLIKRRTVASEVAGTGRIFVNDRPAKAATKLKEGDKVAIEYFNKTIIFEVLKIPTGNVSIQESKDLYRITDEMQHKTN